MESKKLKNKENEETEEDCMALPSDTLAILDEFLQNRTKHESMVSDQGTFEENWQLSQFWYNEGTIRVLSKVCLSLILKRHNVTSPLDVKVALLSCPSLYKSFKSVHPNGVIRLFEFDSRFSSFGEDFVFYDYKDVNRNEFLFKSYESSFDIIIADPPFLSRECIEHTSKIIERIQKNDADIIVCSGQIVSAWLKELLKLNMCKFIPEHQRNLANEFCSFANFDLDSLV